jgi:hypothetical protein
VVVRAVVVVEKLDTLPDLLVWELMVKGFLVVLEDLVQLRVVVVAAVRVKLETLTETLQVVMD